MKKILIVSTVSRQFYLFEQGNIDVLHKLGYEVHAAANYSDANERLDTLDIVRHHIDIHRSPFTLKNIKAYKQLKNIMKTEKLDAVHCHSPMGSILARLAAKSLGISPVIYTAHGFHFFKGAPFLNWLVYYPIERFFARFTDVLITINNEDYNRAKKFAAKKVVYIPGIGVNTNKVSLITKEKKRSELNISEEAVVLLSVGELSRRKNHEVIIKAIAKLKSKNLLYIICGQGDKEYYLRDLARKLGVEGQVEFLGYRSDIHNICCASDIFVFPSLQEGLPVATMEAMSAGLPCIASKIRGNTDLIDEKKGGLLYNPTDVDGFADGISKLAGNHDLRQSMGNYNKEKVKQFDIGNVKRIMFKIYDEVLGDKK